MPHTISLLFLLASLTVSAQVGRNELPADTTPIGGEQQEEKMNRLEGKPMLIQNITVLRDSIHSTIEALDARNSSYSKSRGQRLKQIRLDLTRCQLQLDQSMSEIKRKEWNENVSERSYETLNQVRKEFARIRKELE